MKRFVMAFTLAGALALSGCASVPKGDDDLDAALKTFTAPGDVAGLYVYRYERASAITKMDVEVDGKSIGKTIARTYVYTVLEPGRHRIVSKAKNEDALELEAQPGRLYYVWQEVKPGVFSTRTKLHLVHELDGQTGVRKTRLTVPEMK
ncbi:MAG: DUF2846 domain-containing protein [Azoarcus sp.]|jgi:hypothetical protein|nr:DUF2846 domain-containing protein [Azoarcus sp.]